ncbi:MAG: DUF5017 domain-containing protein [Chlorobi bacterium]|nr:DUF5017 domain-containing protein [Chlorobiota bacterium]
MKKGLLLILSVIFALSMNAQIFSDDFQDGDMSDWLTYTPSYDTVPFNWHLSDYNDDFYLSGSAYDGHTHTSEQWVISPVFSTENYENVTITFDNRQRYTIYQDLELYVSTDFDGDSANFASATWTQVTGLTLDDDPSDYDWATTTDLNLGVDGEATVYIAFKYVSDYESNTGGNWTVNNITINGTETSGISEISNNFKISPNPAVFELNVSSISTIRNLTVSNVIGQTVLSVNNINASNYNLNVADLTKGVYLINIENVDGTSAVTKFVKR